MSIEHTTEEVISFIIDNVSDHPGAIAKVTAEHFDISRQAVNRHLRNLVSDGIIEATGETKARTYILIPIEDHSETFNLTSGLEEDRVWIENIAPLLPDLNKNIYDICAYGFTEIFNNAIDHSGGQFVVVKTILFPNRVELRVADDGVGIFNKIRMDLGLIDIRHAVFELSKGKLTTDPERHTGEGIFFTSRMFDYFAIHSGNLRLAHRGEHDLLFDTDSTNESFDGTYVVMSIATSSKRTLQEVFDAFTAEDDDFGFSKTIIAVDLARYGNENLFSRSQAKRILSRFELFREIILDFKNISVIGQAFADEVFRVFANAHPGISLHWVNTNKNVEKMILRAVNQERTG